MPVDVSSTDRGAAARLAKELRNLDDRRAILSEVRRGILKPVPKIREAIKGKALATMPKRHGLNEWVAAARFAAHITMKARSLSVRMHGSRKSRYRQSDINAIDRGRVRAPSWGRRGPDMWHVQTVQPGFATKTVMVDHFAEWRDAVDDAVHSALRRIDDGA